MDPRIVFMGTPEFALPALTKLAEAFRVVGVVTQPDRPAGRGRVLTPPPVKVLAGELGIPVVQPERLREPEAFTLLQQWEPDLIVVAAYGQILRQDVLDLPPLGCINVHASLLPRWRGASPVQAAILNGDAETGVTIMKMDAGLDSGPLLSRRAIEIFPEENAGPLGDRLARLGAELLVETLPGYLAGEILPAPQDERLVTRAPMLKKEDGQLDFTQPAVSVWRRVRAFNPWPGAFTFWNGQALKVLSAEVVDAPGAAPQKRDILGGRPAIGAVDGWLVLNEVQAAGKKPVAGEVFLRGARRWKEIE